MISNVPIYFYVPNYSEIPVDYLSPEKEEYVDLKSYGISVATNAWLIRTFKKLKAENIQCELTDKFPDEGIVFFTYDVIPFYFQKPSQNLLLVYVKADKPPLPYPNLTIVQNKYQIDNKSYFIPHWSQPVLKCRDSSDLSRFKTVAYIGELGSLAKELKADSWVTKLNSIGLDWSIKLTSSWSDYSDVDVIVAVRDFSIRSSGNYSKDQGKWKPATKLYNAWLAGVPAILGNEPAFIELRQSSLDYIEVNSPDEIIEALLKLRDRPELRQAMIENGLSRAEEFKDSAITQRWIKFIYEVAIPEWEKWRKLSILSRQFFFMKRFINIKLFHYKNKIK